MPRYWQPTLFNRKVRTKTTTTFTFGKGKSTARHVQRHATGIRGTTRKYTVFGDLFDIRKAKAKRRGLF